MDRRRYLGPIVICAGVSLLWLAASGCVVHSHRTVMSAGVIDRVCPTCGLSVAQGCRCATNLRYNATVWFPLAPQCPDKAAPVSERETVVPLPEARPEIEPAPLSAPPETDATGEPSADGGEDQAAESSGEQVVAVVVPEPGLREPSVARDVQGGEADGSRASETPAAAVEEQSAPQADGGGSNSAVASRGL
jgi:hypothetical protein